MVDYAINYTKITTELCENREKPELLCNGFCYLKQEVNKTEKNTSQDHFIKNTVKVLDAIVPQKQHISPKNYLATQKSVGMIELTKHLTDDDIEELEVSLGVTIANTDGIENYLSETENLDYILNE